MSFPYTVNLPLSSNNPIFNLLDCYLSGYDGENYPLSTYSNPNEASQFLLDFFGNEGNYLNSDRFYLSGSECQTVESTETINLSIIDGDNHFTPFSDLEDVALQKALSSSEFINGTAGTTLENSDIFWQFRENCIEGAWLKRSDEEFLRKEACIKLNPNNNEFKFPYPNRGLSAEGIGWTGKGIDNCNLSPYTNPELKSVTEQIEVLYWNESNQLSSVGPVPLNESSLIYDSDNLSSSPYPHENYFYADQIKVKDTRDDTTGEKVAWYRKFTNTELSISCGDNIIYYPFFVGEDDYGFNINVDQVEDLYLSAVDIRCSMKGSLAGNTPEEADNIYKLNGECNGQIEGAWLSGCSYRSEEFIWLSSDISDFILSSEILNDQGTLLLSSFNIKGGVLSSYTDCGEVINFTTPLEQFNTIISLSSIDYDSDYSYYLTEGEFGDGIYNFSVEGESQDDFKPDTSINLNLSSNGYNEMTVWDEFGNQTKVDVTEIRECIREKKYCLDKTTKQNTFSAVFDSDDIGYFQWSFPDVMATDVVNGTGHDECCEYLNIDDYDDTINPSSNDIGDQWKKCSCKAVYYSPIGNNLDRFDDFTNFSDFIFEDTMENFNLSEWVDSEGEGYRTSKSFGIYVVSNSENAVEHNQINGVAMGSTGTWQTFSGDDFVLKEGKKYGYKRADFGGCSSEKPPCVVFNNTACYDGCQDGRLNPVWIKMIQGQDGGWIDTGEISNMVLEASKFYTYDRKDALSYQALLSGENCVERLTHTPSFMINIDYDDALPYWAESSSIGGLNYGLSSYDITSYLKGTQPKPSDIILTDDLYVQYYRNNNSPFIWKQPVNFSVDFDIPNVWKEIDFGFQSPSLLKKIVGCGGCEMHFEDSPQNSCHISEDKCDVYVACISGTDIDSSMVIRNSLNCGDQTQIFYKAINSYEINQTLESNNNTGGYLSGEYMEATNPWRNLDNEDNTVYLDERNGRLVTDDEIGLFKPHCVGNNKIICTETYDLQDINCSN